MSNLKFIESPVSIACQKKYSNLNFIERAKSSLCHFALVSGSDRASPTQTLKSLFFWRPKCTFFNLHSCLSCPFVSIQSPVEN